MKTKGQLTRPTGAHSAGTKSPRSKFFRNIFLAASASAAVAVGSKLFLERNLERKAAQETQRKQLTEQVEKAGFDKKSQPIFAIYKLNPTNKVHTAAVRALGTIAKSTKLSPARIMLTLEANMGSIEENQLSKFLVDSLSTNSKAHPENKAKNDRIISVVYAFNKLPEVERAHLIEMASQRETYDKLKSVVANE